MIESRPALGSRWDFRSACGRFATGVTVLTTMRSDGMPLGMTVSSFTSVSLEPPLLLVCLHERCSLLRDVVQTGRFGLNILSSHQQEVSSRFAEHIADRFQGLNWSHGTSGVPLLSDVLATIECEVDRAYPCGDHQILIGRASKICTYDGAPLIRFSSAYHSLTQP